VIKYLLGQIPNGPKKHALVLPLSSPKYKQNIPLPGSSLVGYTRLFLGFYVYSLLQIACANVLGPFISLTPHLTASLILMRLTKLVLMC